MDNYIFIIPEKILYLFLLTIKTYGINLSEYTEEAFNILLTYNGENNYDAP